MPQLLVRGPSAIVNFGKEVSFDPHHTLSGQARKPLGERALLAAERLKLLPERAHRLGSEAGSNPPGVLGACLVGCQDGHSRNALDAECAGRTSGKVKNAASNKRPSVVNPDNDSTSASGIDHSQPRPEG